MDTDASEVEDILDAEEVVDVTESGEEEEQEQEEEQEEHVAEPTEPDRPEEIIYVVPPEKWRTTDILSIFEMTRLVTLRATEIESSPGTATIDINGLDDALVIAKQELMQRKCPLLVQREVSVKQVVENGVRKNIITVELRDPNKMRFSVIYDDVRA